MNNLGNVITLFALLAVSGSARAQNNETNRGLAQRSVAKTFASIDRVALTSPEGAFYAGATDKRIVARDNAAMIVALTELFTASGDATKVGRAIRAGRYLKSMKDSDGCYGSPEDTLAMTGAAIALYKATAATEWLREARALVQASESMVLGDEARAQLAVYVHDLSVIDQAAPTAIAQF